MRQTLTLLGTLERLAIRNATPHAAPDAVRLEARLRLELDRPAAARSSRSVPGIVFDAQLPELEAVRQARPGDRVEVVGHWHGFDGVHPSGNLVTIHLFEIERFRVIDH